VYAAAATAGVLLIGLFIYFHILNEINLASNVVILKFESTVITSFKLRWCTHDHTSWGHSLLSLTI